MSTEVAQRIAELKEQQGFVRAKALEVVADARAVFAADLPQFVLRELKKAFVASPAFAEGWTDEQIRALKQEAQAKGKEVADQIGEALADDDLWMRGAQHVEGARSLEDHPELWAKLTPICDLARELMVAHGFPGAADAKLQYKQPAWFISGKLMTTVAEKYWRKMVELVALERELEELDGAQRREALKRRWDSIR